MIGAVKVLNAPAPTIGRNPAWSAWVSKPRSSSGRAGRRKAGSYCHGSRMKKSSSVLMGSSKPRRQREPPCGTKDTEILTFGIVVFLWTRGFSRFIWVISATG